MIVTGVAPHFFPSFIQLRLSPLQFGGSLMLFLLFGRRLFLMGTVLDSIRQHQRIKITFCSLLCKTFSVHVPYETGEGILCWVLLSDHCKCINFQNLHIVARRDRLHDEVEPCSGGDKQYHSVLSWYHFAPPVQTIGSSGRLSHLMYCW